MDSKDLEWQSLGASCGRLQKTSSILTLTSAAMTSSPVLYTEDGPYLPPQFDVSELRERLHWPTPEILPPMPEAGWKTLVRV